MKYFIRNNCCTFIFGSFLIGFFGGMIFRDFQVGKEEVLSSDLNALKKDVYLARQYMMILESVGNEASTHSYDVFIPCALQDTYSKIDRNVSRLMQLDSDSEKAHEAIKVHQIERARIEKYWLTAGKFDCEDNGWMN